MTDLNPAGTQPGTLDHYANFISRAAMQLSSEPADKVVWHYTNGDGLIGIIESGSIYATQIACLNDNTEMRYSSSLLRQQLLEARKTIVGDDRLASFISRFINFLDDDDKNPNSATLPFYVCSFSRKGDDLAQWRAYGGGENGYAIGLHTRNVSRIPDTISVQVNYNNQTHLEVAKEVAQATIDFYQEGIHAGIENWDDKFLWTWDVQLSKIGALVKDPGFEQEEEVRIIHLRSEKDVPFEVIRQRRSLMSRHIPLNFSGLEGKLPLEYVMVGPARHRAISAESVKALLQKKGYPTGLVRVSSRPFQEI
jgi:Protein of unknown function (DUF2971)